MCQAEGLCIGWSFAGRIVKGHPVMKGTAHRLRSWVERRAIAAEIGVSIKYFETTPL